MDFSDLEQRISALPEVARREVEVLVSQLERVYAATDSSSEVSTGDIREHSFVGMWSGRTNMTDSVEWVRSVRDRQWGPSDE